MGIKWFSAINSVALFLFTFAIMLALPPSTGVYSILCEFGLVSYPESVRNFFTDVKCPSGEPLEHFRMIVMDESERGLKVMNGQGVYINTIDEPNIVIIPKHLIE